MYNNNNSTGLVMMLLSCCSLSIAVVIIIIVTVVLLRKNNSVPWLPGGGETKQGTPVPIANGMLTKNTEPWNIAGFGGDESSISVAGGSVVYRLKKNTSGGESGGMFTANPHNVFPTEAAQLEFDVFLPDTFPLKPDSKIKMIGGKLWGFCLGKQFKDCATGGNYNADKGSVRMTFNAKESLVATVYVYPPAKSSDDAWGKQGDGYKKVGHATNKGHKLFFGTGNTMPLKHGWNSVSLYVKLNTPGQKDGVIRSTVNGVTNEVSDAVLRGDGSVKLTSLKGNVFLGGSGKEWEFDRDVDVSITNVHISSF